MKKIPSKLKTATTTIILALLMASTILTATKPVEAQTGSYPQPVAGPLTSGVTPDTTLSVTGAYLSVTPSRIGVGQQLLINTWIIPPTDRNRAFIDSFKVTITKPNGQEEILGPTDSFCGDGTQWFSYTPEEEGDYTFVFDFLGQYFPAGYYYNGVNYPDMAAIYASDPNLAVTLQTTYGSMSAPKYLGSAYYEPATSKVVSVTVQKDMVASWPVDPFPTDYWTRPVYSEKRDWWPILGNWPATGIVGGGTAWPENTNTYISDYDYVPYVQAPSSSHIVWRRQGAEGGLVGGTKGQITYDLFAGTGEIGYPSIIYNGRCYQTITKVSTSSATSQNYWQCYDLRTGEIYWERPVYAGETMPTIIEYAADNQEVPGAEARVGTTIYLVSLTAASENTSGRILKYNPWNGALLINITGIPPGVSGTTLYGYPYVLSVQNKGGGQYRLINWTIENLAGEGKAYSAYALSPVTDNFTARIVSNITWPFSSIGTCDFETGYSVTAASISDVGTGVASGTIL